MNYRQQIGYYGETLAIKYLKRKGYKILKRNIRIGHKEIDIIAKHNKDIVFDILNNGAKKASIVAQEKIEHVRSIVGLYKY